MADETFTGTVGADVFVAPNNDNWTINGKGGSDTLTGGGGNDTIVGGFGNDVLDGGPGDDVFIDGLKDGVDVIHGGDGFDRIVASVDNAKIGLSAFDGLEEISANGHANVTIVGSVNADVLDFSHVALVGITSINSGGGDDTVTGTEFGDVINGGSGSDILNGAGGDDTFLAGFSSGFDAYDGGTGTNVIQAVNDNVKIGIGSFANIQEISAGGFANVSLLFDGSNQTIDLRHVVLTDIALIDAGGGDDTVYGTIGDDNINGGFGNDILNGGDGADILNGGGGFDTLNGGGGDDTFLVNSGGAGQDLFRGGTGYDIIQANSDFAKIILSTGSMTGVEEISAGGFSGVTIEGTTANDVINLAGIVLTEGDIASINGGAGDDTITGSKISDTITGGAGDDHVLGLVGDDIINGNQGDDVVDGGAGADTIGGDAGNDTLLGGFGADTVDGGTGNDTINGGGGDDILTGGTGDDVFQVSALGGFDSYDGGDGVDAIVATAKNVAIGITSITGVESISAKGFDGVTVTGTTGDDTLDFSNITLTGIKSINGLAGSDALTGSAGSDVLSGGAGTDTLTGGAGDDIFRDKIADLTGDTITDLSSGDKIDVTNLATPAKVTFALVGSDLMIDPDGAGKLKAFAIHLQGVFDVAGFHATSDGAAGTFVSYTAPEPILHSTHLALIA